MSGEISHQSISVQRTAHYSTYGTLDKAKTKYIWIVMHGYGQLAKRMIHKFEVLDPNEHFVVLAEGLNKFYWHSKERAPVACWMTSENRYAEIDDFTRYLDQLYNRYVQHVNQEKVKVVLMGFSQGCATMWRWIHSKRPNYDIAINWAGWIPEDISYLHLKDYLSDKEHHLWYGDEDHLLTETSMKDIEKVISENRLDINLEKYKGGHKVIRKELKRFVETYLEGS